MAVVGATGTGKSAFALSLAQALVASGRPAEIVNADAMQLYRGMDIGTAKLPLDQRGGIPHHLFDLWEVTKEASVADYQTIARATILEILSRRQGGRLRAPTLWLRNCGPKIPSLLPLLTRRTPVG